MDEVPPGHLRLLLCAPSVSASEAQGHHLRVEPVDDAEGEIGAAGEVVMEPLDGYSGVGGDLFVGLLCGEVRPVGGDLAPGRVHEGFAFPVCVACGGVVGHGRYLSMTGARSATISSWVRSVTGENFSR